MRLLLRHFTADRIDDISAIFLKIPAVQQWAAIIIVRAI
jgi:hypothetical protein